MSQKQFMMGLGLVFAVFLLIQLVPVSRVNPPVQEELSASDDVRSALRRVCYDCHSNQTKWPWYSRVAPVSWLVTRDVNAGRKAVNYSEWNRLDAKKRGEMIWETWEEIDEGEMPPRIYVVAHGEARFSKEELAAIQSWANREGIAEQEQDDDDDDDDDDEH